MGTRSHRESPDETVTVTHEGRWYVARDDSTGIASQGETKVEALENLADALELHNRPVPESDREEDLEPSSAPWL